MVPKEDYATLQIVGEREEQQDEAWVFSRPKNNCVHALVADGMGGHAGGAMAAKLVSDAFRSIVSLTPLSRTVDFKQALEAADAAIAKGVKQDRALREMGSTVVGLELKARKLRWVSVGDSLLLLWSAGALKRLNADHSMAPILDGQARRGDITEEEARNSPSRNALRSAITGDQIDLVDLESEGVDLPETGWLIVASDGLEVLSEQVLAGVIAERQSESAYSMCEHLLDAIEAQRSPHQDNATLVAIRLS